MEALRADASHYIKVAAESRNSETQVAHTMLLLMRY